MVNDNCDKINITSIFVQPIEIIFSLFYQDLEVNELFLLLFII